MRVILFWFTRIKPLFGKISSIGDLKYLFGNSFIIWDWRVSSLTLWSLATHNTNLGYNIHVNGWDMTYWGWDIPQLEIILPNCDIFVLLSSLLDKCKPWYKWIFSYIISPKKRVQSQLGSLNQKVKAGLTRLVLVINSKTETGLGLGSKSLWISKLSLARA